MTFEEVVVMAVGMLDFPRTLMAQTVEEMPVEKVVMFVKIKKFADQICHHFMYYWRKE